MYVVSHPHIDPPQSCLASQGTAGSAWAERHLLAVWQSAASPRAYQTLAMQQDIFRTAGVRTRLYRV